MPEKLVIHEHWWNTQWGRQRRTVRLQRGSSDMGTGIWQLRVQWREFEKTLDYRTEADARTELALLLAENGPWKRIRSAEDVHPDE